MVGDVNFKSDELRLYGRLPIPSNYKIGVVFLHGGGHSNTSRYKLLQTEFEKKGIASLAFDFRGCGKSEGIFENGSLERRIIDAKNAVKFFAKESKLDINNIYIWGSSMGGYVACMISDVFDFKGIILQSAAAYSIESESAPLNETFTNLISKENSWQNSKSFEAFENFENRKLVIYGENDDVIPNGVKERYKLLLKVGDKYITIPGGSHKLLSPQSGTEKEALNKLINIAYEFILE